VRSRATAAEFIGTALLSFVVVGSGVTVERLGADGASRLFFHAVMVGLGLAVLVALFASTSGAHFNPAVTLALWRRQSLDRRTAVGYSLAQIAGAIAGVMLALISFGDAVPSFSSTTRGGAGALLAELVGTLILVMLIPALTDQGRSNWIPAAVGAWVATMVFSTVSTGFLNPALTLARMFTDTYTGIAPANVPGFMIAQLLGAALAIQLSIRLLIVPDPKGT
jgi:glycerol uptake facilitator-like aquaporin